MAPRKKSAKTAAHHLTPRQWVLLLMVDENTDIDEGSGELFQYFHGEDNFNSDFLVSFQKDPVRLWEVGDREAMAGLVDAGFLSVPFAGEYNFVVTPLGHACATKCLQQDAGAHPQPEPKKARKKRATPATTHPGNNSGVLRGNQAADCTDGGFSGALPPSGVGDDPEGALDAGRVHPGPLRVDQPGDGSRVSPPGSHHPGSEGELFC